MIKKIFLFSFFIFGWVSISLVTSAQVGSASELQDLKQRVDTLYKTNEKNYQDVAKAMSLLTQIQQEFQSVRGTLDASKVIQTESDKVYQDLDMRVSALEDKIDQIHKLVKEIRSSSLSTEKPTAVTSPKEVDEFQTLLNMVNAQDYHAAASGFLGFLKKYPQSQYAGSAQYWLAESFYSMGDYAKAISEFQKLNEKYPQHPRVKEAVYKQGLAFMRMKKYSEAKLFFQKVIATYPSSAEAQQAKARILRIEELEKTTPNLASNQPMPNSVPTAVQPAMTNTPPTSQVPPPSSIPPQAPTQGEPSGARDSNAPLF